HHGRSLSWSCRPTSSNRNVTFLPSVRMTGVAPGCPSKTFRAFIPQPVASFWPYSESVKWRENRRERPFLGHSSSPIFLKKKALLRTPNVRVFLVNHSPAGRPRPEIVASPPTH